MFSSANVDFNEDIDEQSISKKTETENEKKNKIQLTFSLNNSRNIICLELASFECTNTQTKRKEYTTDFYHSEYFNIK